MATEIYDANIIDVIVSDKKKRLILKDYLIFMLVFKNSRKQMVLSSNPEARHTINVGEKPA